MFSSVRTLPIIIMMMMMMIMTTIMMMTKVENNTQCKINVKHFSISSSISMVLNNFLLQK